MCNIKDRTERRRDRVEGRCCNNILYNAKLSCFWCEGICFEIGEKFVGKTIMFLFLKKLQFCNLYNWKQVFMVVLWNELEGNVTTKNAKNYVCHTQLLHFDVYHLQRSSALRSFWILSSFFQESQSSLPERWMTKTFVMKQTFWLIHETSEEMHLNVLFSYQSWSAPLPVSTVRFSICLRFKFLQTLEWILFEELNNTKGMSQVS